MAPLQQACSRLVDRYLLAQAAVLILIGGPTLYLRFFDGRLALTFGGFLIAALVLNTILARRSWCRLTRVWACHEADRYHASARCGEWGAFTEGGGTLAQRTYVSADCREREAGGAGRAVPSLR
jgi:hypothetical protein